MKRRATRRLSQHWKIAILPITLLSDCMLKAIIHAARGIMGGGKGRHGQGAESLGIPGAQGPQQRGDVRYLPQQGGAHGGGGEYRGTRVLQQHPQPGGVVGMGMGDENGGQGLGRPVKRPQGGLNAPGGDACVHQNVNIAGADQGGVALGPAGQSMYGNQMSDLACDFGYYGLPHR